MRTVHRNLKYVLALAGLWSLWLLVPISSEVVHAQQTSPKSVLILNSYHSGLSWTDNIVAGIYSVLLDPEQNFNVDDLQIYVEYMDTKRFAATSDYLEEMYRFYLEKYRDVNLDLVIVSDNNAFNFIKSYYGLLFPDTPVVFCGVNFFKSQDIENYELFTGVQESVDIRATLDLMLKIHPETEQIVVINDTTVTGQLVQQEFDLIRPEYASRVDFVVYQDIVLADLLDKIRDLPEHTLVFLILFNRDQAGQFFSYEQGVELISGASNRPIYGVWDFYLGHGLVGGMLTSGQAQGEVAGTLSLRVLKGEDVRTLSVEESPNRYMFDYAEMEKFDIPLVSLPGYRPDFPGVSYVFNQPPSFLEKYGLLVGGTTIILLVLSVVFALQWRYLDQQRHAQAELQVRNQELQATRASLEERVIERTQALEKRSEQLRISALVAREVAAIRDMGELMESIVQLIARHFDFYHVGIFLLDDVGDFAVLQAVSSEGGQQMLERGHKLRVAEQGIVGYVAARGEPRIALDVGEDAAWFNTPELPATRSEMALPFRLRDQIIGVLDVQSDQPQAFAQEDVQILQTLAGQLAIAIQNARLFDENRRTVRRLEHLYREQVGEIWRDQVMRRAFAYDGLAVSPAEADMQLSIEPEIAQARVLKIPVPVRDRVIGTIELTRDEAQDPWSVEDLALAAEIGIQAGLALENAQLLAESRQRVARQQQLSEISARVSRSVDVDTMLRIAARELGHLPGVVEVAVHVDLPTSSEASLNLDPEQQQEREVSGYES